MRLSWSWSWPKWEWKRKKKNIIIYTHKIVLKWTSNRQPQQQQCTCDQKRKTKNQSCLDDAERHTRARGRTVLSELMNAARLPDQRARLLVALNRQICRRITETENIQNNNQIPAPRREAELLPDANTKLWSCKQKKRLNRKSMFVISQSLFLILLGRTGVVLEYNAQEWRGIYRKCNNPSRVLSSVTHSSDKI